MIYNLRSVKEADVKDKIVLLRADLDVPIKNSTILDDSRLKAWFKTFEYLLENQTQIIIAGHLGRPDGKSEKLSLLPVVSWLKRKLRLTKKLELCEKDGFSGWELTDDIFFLENLRFFKEEEENNPQFAQKLASLAQIYVNDAFASSHRAHASIVAITKFLPSFAGLRLLEEVKVLSQILENPKRPLGVVIGGAKIETKLPLVEKMHKFADYVLVGGEIAENDRVILKVAHEKTPGRSILLISERQGEDATLKSVENFLQVLKNSQTIVWNGPLGQIEKKRWQKGTEILAQGIVKTSAFTVVGGGDTIGFLKKLGLLNKFSFVSTGGGAMLEFLSGEKLPGLIALEQK